MILDWVPAHFPSDGHGLRRFDGTACYEHEDPAKGEHPDWGTMIFNYGRTRSAISCSPTPCSGSTSTTSTACGSMRSPRCSISITAARKGEWIPNQYGGRENLEAISPAARVQHPRPRQLPGRADDRRGIDRLGRRLAADVHRRPGLLAQVEHGLDERHAPLHAATSRFTASYHHDELTFSLIYAFTENFCLPLSHDEVVHGKRSLLVQMPGDLWQKFANLRLLYSLHVDASRQEAALHGGRVRPVERMERTTPSCSGTCCSGKRTAA